MKQTVEPMSTSLVKKFRTLFNEEPLVVRAPGRVNIIGEHTDYNGGFVLPAAIDKAIYVAVGRRKDEAIHLYSQEFQEGYEGSLSTLAITDKGWPNYILGVADQLRKGDCAIGGFNLVLDGDVPLGAGLSSSAAVECATALALSELFSLDVDRMELVKVAQRAEHAFAGVRCGIMDQFASMFGKKDHVIKLDCRSLEYEYIPLQLKGFKIVLFNTNVKHNLSSSEYNTRRQQCEQGVAWVKEQDPQVDSLRDVSLDMLKRIVLPKDELIYKRCKYVVEETGRLLQACEDLKRGDVVSLGQKMFETHEGLSCEFEVSCRELDVLVNCVKGHPAVIGARMMGGGFGGCTINLVKEEAVEELIQRVTKAYAKQVGFEPSVYIANVAPGSQCISEPLAV